MLPNGESIVATVMRDNGSEQSVVLSLKDIALRQNKKASQKGARYLPMPGNPTTDPYEK